jgi:hypothetical protein
VTGRASKVSRNSYFQQGQQSYQYRTKADCTLATVLISCRLVFAQVLQLGMSRFAGFLSADILDT